MLLYAYRLTGDERYFEAARQNADIVLSLQNEDAFPRLQFIFNVLLADGKISPEFLYQMNRGLQYPHFHEKWEITGDWTQQSAAIEDWLSFTF